MEATSQATSQYVSLAQEYIGGAKKTAVDKGYVSKDTAAKLPGAPVEKDYTSSPAKDTTSSSAPVDQSSSPVASNEKPVTSHSGPDFPVAPIENISSSTEPTPVVGSTDFPAAPSNEPLHHEVPAAPSAIDTEVHGIEEKKEPLHAI